MVLLHSVLRSLPGVVFSYFYSGQQLDGVTSILLGDVPCLVLRHSSTEVVCTAGSHAAGDANVLVHVADKGFATPSTYQYELIVDDIAPNSGNPKPMSSDWYLLDSIKLTPLI